MLHRIPEKPLRAVILALIIILAGPELFAALELITLLELLGAANLLLLYLYGFSALGSAVVKNILRVVQLLEPNVVFVPSWRVLRRMPTMIAHAVPIYCLAIVSTVLMVSAIAWQGIQTW